MNGYITDAEVLSAQDMLGNVGVRLNIFTREGWEHHMINPERAVEIGEQLIRQGQNALTSNAIRDDPSHMLVMRERAGLSVSS